MNWLRFLLGRLAQGVVALFVIATLNFLLIRAAPGDPVAVMAGEAGAVDKRFLDALRIQYGLDQPLLTQWWTYISRIATLDLGFSYRQQQTVAQLIAERLPATLLLTLSAFFFSLVVGIGFGVLASRRPGGWVDRIIGFAALIFYAAPMYWLALMAVLVFSIQLGWLPAFGYSSVGANLTGLAAALDIAKHLILPTLALSFFYIAVYTRMTRANMMAMAQMAFVKTARAKGAAESRIQFRHVLRNALLPVVTLAGLQAGNMVGGAIMTETVFAWPGIGRLMFDALLQRDYNLLLGAFLVAAALAIVFNIITDLIYTVIDPRIAL
ncbi:Dipeptide transport system permease protein DppB [Hyphomicrobiales bacterium]|nr:Dipeptide transport system permease protein DppB [Hyphomicrobiales bacterium]CAH1674957.1 Dipeptide transport system permease protein DppB [Hyphomicrobiales bacterium]